jgi:hypothetical protein
MPRPLHHQIADRTADLALTCVPALKRILDVGCRADYLLTVLAARARRPRPWPESTRHSQ